jgi:hypothetical protein
MNRAESDAGGTLPAVVRLANMGTWLRGRTGTTRVLLVVGRHVLWIALFTLPSIALWWHVWTGHPSSTLTCPCGDPAQEVWFMAWPAWAVEHAANPFFSGAVNVPHGANLLSNTAGTLVGIVLSPVTWLWGPVAATNVALTLAPGLSAWGCWLALRSFVGWKPGAIPAALVYGYSAALVTSLLFGHVSVSVLPVPPLLLLSLYAIVVRQARTPWRDGLLLAGLIVVQFLISPEILVMCVLFAVVGLVVAAAVWWRTLPSRLPYAARSLGVGVGLSAALLAYPAWFGLAGPQAVSGVLFATSAIAGVYLSGYLSPGPYGELANSVTRFGGYYGPTGPPSNYLGWGTAVGTVVALFFARRRPLAWLLALLALVAMWLSLGSYLLGGTLVLSRGWMPWRTLSKLPVLKEILPDQLTPFTTLFISFVLALGLDALYRHVKATSKKQALRVEAIPGLATLAIGVAALLPVFWTFGLPLTVQSTAIPAWMARNAPSLPHNTVLLTVPFAVSGSAQPMLWQAVDDMHFRLAGAAMKTPDATGGPVGQGALGSARRILSDLSVGAVVGGEPTGTAAQLSTVRAALRTWRVTEVVIDGPSSDPVYASGFLTAALGAAPSYVRRAWVWKIPAGGPAAPPASGGALTRCAATSAGSAGRAGRAGPQHPLAMAACVLGAAPSSG